MKKLHEALVNSTLWAVALQELVRRKASSVAWATLSICDCFSGVFFFSGMFIGGSVLAMWSVRNNDAPSLPDPIYLIGIAMLSGALFRLMAWMFKDSKRPTGQH